jgi:hypothetical protein
MSFQSGRPTGTVMQLSDIGRCTAESTDWSAADAFCANAVSKASRAAKSNHCCPAKALALGDGVLGDRTRLPLSHPRREQERLYRLAPSLVRGVQCLCRLKPDLRGRNQARIRGKFDGVVRDRKLLHINDLCWLCWQSAANYSQRAQIP